MKFRLIPGTMMIFAAALFAQGPGPHMHGMGMHGMMAMEGPAKTDQVASYLKLTEAQIQSLQQIRTAAAAAMKPIMDQMGPLHETLHNQMTSSNADASAVGKAMLSMKSLHEQLKTAQDGFRTQAMAVLTADQKTKLSTLESAVSLMPTIHQAMGLNLLAPPEHGPGGPEAEQ